MILIDTHILVWLCGESNRLSAEAYRVIQTAGRMKFSAITLWEVAMLRSKERIELNKPMLEWLEDVCNNPEFEMVPITPRIAARSGDLKMHGDPADRIIVATALELGVPLLTADKAIRNAGVVTCVG
ncbi:MAG: type II toxin-antitoxin system VapC family toxin [Thermoguttaceae bacterium]